MIDAATRIAHIAHRLLTGSPGEACMRSGRLMLKEPTDLSDIALVELVLAGKIV